MKPWETRNTEEANLFNPAFVGLLCCQSIKEYSDESHGEVPYQLPFIVTPLILHKRTRKTLPLRTRKTFVSWITSPEGTNAKINYATHTKSFVPIVREALAFSMINRMLSITTQGSIIFDNKKPTLQGLNDWTEEVNDCFNRAGFCGRWLARAGKIETVMALLGIEP